MALIIQFLWISFIFIQGFLAITTLTLCKKKKAAPPTPATTATPGVEGDKKQQDKTADKTAATSPTGAQKGGAAGGGGGGETAAAANKGGAVVAAPSAEKAKTEKKAAAGAFDDTDLKSLPTDKRPLPPPPAPAEVTPMSTIVPVGNDNKFISKGNGVFVDKDGNPISVLAQPAAKDDAPAG